MSDSIPNQRSEAATAALLRVVGGAPPDVSEIKKTLPLAKVKRTVKTDPDVHMVHEETSLLIIRLCEIFITDLTIRAWHEKEDQMNDRGTLQAEDLAQVIHNTELFDFLRDMVSLPAPNSFASGG